MEPGTTVMGINYNLIFNFSAASAAAALDHVISWGILVGLDTLDAADMDPSVHVHLPWLDWGFNSFNSGASVNVAATAHPAQGNSMDGHVYAKVRARRRLDNINETCWLCVKATTPAGTWGFDYSASVHLALP